MGPPGDTVPSIRPAERALPGAIAGVLRDALGVALAGTTVLAIAADGSDADETFTDDDGFFLMPALRPGRYALFAGLGTPLVSQVGARGVSITDGGAVARVDLVAPARGATVRVRAVGPDGRAEPAQAVLVPGAPGAEGTFAALLAADAIYLPDDQMPRLVVQHVPPGEYTVVLLRGGSTTVVAAKDVVRVAGDDVLIEVRLPAPVPPRVSAM